MMLTPNAIRSLMSVVLLACYDRKVTRDFFAEIIDDVTEIEMTVADIEEASSLRAAMAIMKPEEKATMVEECILDLVKEWTTKRESLAKKFSLVTQCPTLEDKIS